ncbi:MAG: hypothetical protein VKK05_03780 [Synechococcus sp.]|nr:hypothetical protein [Synechococcus sp.]
MDNVCIFTICHRETFFLPRWINYYRNFIHAKNIFILLHNDDTPIDSDINTLKLKTDTVFDHRWLRDVVENFQRFLLCTYKCVIFAEIDEFIYSTDYQFADNIQRFLIDDTISHQTVYGYDIVQGDEEPYLSDNIYDTIISKRKYRVRRKDFDKTLISKRPIRYTCGFHATLDKTIPDFRYNFTMAHLHKVDKQLIINRHLDRLHLNVCDDKLGEHNKNPDPDYILNYLYYGNNNNKQSQEIIPDIDREALSLL